MSPFELARSIGNNLSGAFERVKDQNTIDSILSDIAQNGDPQVMNDAIGKILSNVSPERQAPAIQYIQNSMQRIAGQQQELRQQQAALEGGYTYGAPPAVQAAQVKAKQPAKTAGGISGAPVPPEISKSINNIVDENKGANADQLALEFDKQGIPRAYSNSYIENRRRQDEGKIKRHTDISQKVLENADVIAEKLPVKKASLDLMKNAIANKDLSFWSPDNLAEMSGLEGFRSPEGAIFKTAGKEFFLGNISRAGARPNQWIEQQIAEMMPKMGRSTAANLSVSRALENEIDLDQERVILTERISNELEDKLGYVPRNIGSKLNKELQSYAERKQSELYNDLRAIKSIEDKSIQKFMKVLEGTPISKYVAKVLLNQYNNDPKKASEEAKKLGYSF